MGCLCFEIENASQDVLIETSLDLLSWRPLESQKDFQYAGSGDGIVKSVTLARPILFDPNRYFRVWVNAEAVRLE